MTARGVGFECADGHCQGIDMAIARHPQTFRACKPSDDIPPTRYGYPFKIRNPTKLGFKSAKLVTTLYVTNQLPRGFWSDREFNGFSGI